MSVNPSPLPSNNPMRRHLFCHQVLGYPVNDEWLEKRAIQLTGKRWETVKAAGMMRAVPGFEHSTLRLVYHPVNRDETMLCIAMAENTSTALMQDLPEELVERMRKHTGHSGRPLWYDIAG